MAFYGYPRAAVLAEPTPAFWTLLAAVVRLEAQRDLRALQLQAVVASPGKKGEHFKALFEDLRQDAGWQKKADPAQAPQPGITPGVKAAEQPGEIAALRARQRAAHEARLREHQERLKRQREQG